MRYLISGEPHGPQLAMIIGDVPANLEMRTGEINREMFKCQDRYGRGRRMQIEKDAVEIVSGTRNGFTLGSPVTIVARNDDFIHWKNIMGTEPISDGVRENTKRTITKPRPGHADLIGGMKYSHRDLRNVLECSSVREAAARVAIGAVPKILLPQLDIHMYSRAVEISGIKDVGLYDTKTFKQSIDKSNVRVIDESVTQKIRDKADEVKKEGDFIDGVAQVTVGNMPVAVGSYVHYNRKFGGHIVQDVVSINAFKGASFGEGSKTAEKPGSEIRDEILHHSEGGYYKGLSHLGGSEGGTTNGMPIIVGDVMKPTPTSYRLLDSVNINTEGGFKVTIERSDSCTVSAASVAYEHVIAFEIVKASLERFQSNHIGQPKEQIGERRRLNAKF